MGRRRWIAGGTDHRCRPPRCEKIGIVPATIGASRGTARLMPSGRTVLDTGTKIDLTISGLAEPIAFGSATPFAVGSLQSSQAQIWNGRALAIVRGQGVQAESSSKPLAPACGRGAQRFAWVKLALGGGLPIPHRAVFQARDR